jgi:hypothetical protein
MYIKNMPMDLSIQITKNIIIQKILHNINFVKIIIARPKNQN